MNPLITANHEWIVRPLTNGRRCSCVEIRGTVYGVHPRTATRIVVSIVMFAGFIVWFHEPLFTLLGALSSPDGISSRRLTLFLLATLSTLIPLLVATALVDAL